MTKQNNLTAESVEKTSNISEGTTNLRELITEAGKTSTSMLRFPEIPERPTLEQLEKIEEKEPFEEWSDMEDEINSDK